MTTSFRLYQLARFSVIIAMQMLSVAVGWRLYEATNQPISLGFVGPRSSSRCRVCRS